MKATDATCQKTADELQQDLEMLLDIDAFWHQLELLGVTDIDDIVLCNWRSLGNNLDAMHQHVALSGGDVAPRVKGGPYSFGFIPSKPLPIPDGWKPGWSTLETWDPELEVCWKEETWGTKKKQIECCRALMADSDGGIDLAEARRIIKKIGLPQPTIVINTGGRGWHFTGSTRCRCRRRSTPT